MKKLLCILIVGMVFAQTKLETRVYPLPMSCNVDEGEVIFDIQQITGYDLESAIVQFYSVKYLDEPEDGWLEIRFDIYQPNTNFYAAQVEYYEGGLTNAILKPSQFIYSKSSSIVYELEYDCIGTSGFSGDYILEFAVTSEFPNDDIGLEGDLNQDGGVNIIDVLALVDIILETGVGDVNTLKDMVRG